MKTLEELLNNLPLYISHKGYFQFYDLTIHHYRDGWVISYFDIGNRLLYVWDNEEEVTFYAKNQSLIECIKRIQSLIEEYRDKLDCAYADR